MAVVLGHEEDVNWLKEKANRLKTLVADCWNEKNARFQNRDVLNHTSLKPGKAILYHRNGSFPIHDKKSSSSFTIIKVKVRDGILHPFSIEMAFGRGKKMTLTEKEFELSGNYAIALINRTLESISAIKNQRFAAGRVGENS